jgi:hypothetical protein
MLADRAQQLKGRSMRTLTLALLLSLTSAAATAQTAGSGTVSGGERIKASGCGKESAPISVAVTVDGTGAWTANVNGDVFSGTSITTRRTANLTLDAGSLALLDTLLEDQVSGLCEETVSINSLAVTRARLKINKRQTGAKLAFRAVGSGTSTSGSGTGAYRIKARGTWTPAP